MFWIDIPAGLALLVLAVYLIDSLLEKIVDAFEKAAATRRQRRHFEAYDLYVELKNLNPSQRQEFLKTLPYRKRKQYEYALAVWGKYE